MTVESAPVRPLWRSALRKRLSASPAFSTVRLPFMLLACAATGCVLGALGACSERESDTRVALTTSAARELAQVQPGNSQRPPLANAFTLASDAASSNSPDPANSGANGAALPALAVRSPARPPGAGTGAQGLQDAPLATPEIHTAD